MIDEKRNEIQDITVDTWFETGKRGTVNLHTGLGKTFVFIKICKLLCKTDWKKQLAKPTVLFLAETRQRDIDLQLDIKKFNDLFGWNLLDFVNLHFDCYQSAYKWKNEVFDLVCADEIHDALTPSYSKFFENNICKCLLGLSATIDRTIKYKDENGIEYTKGDLVDKICPVVFRYTINNAVTDGTTKNLKIYVIDHRLDTVNKTILSGTKDKPFYTTELEAYNYWDNEFKRSLYLPDGPAKTFRIRNTSAARAKILYIAPSKIKASLELLSKLKGKNLIFGNNIDALHQITTNIISSKNSTKKNEEIRKDFNEGKIITIGSFKMLKQGANLSHLDNTIIHSYYSKELDFLQRLGRQRVSETLGNIFIFRTVLTVETKWYEKAMLNINNYEIIYCTNVEDCINKYLQTSTEITQNA